MTNPRSTLDLTIYTAPKPKLEKCPVCGRGPNWFAGCSVVECPNRTRYTAMPAVQPRERSDDE